VRRAVAALVRVRQDRVVPVRAADVRRPRLDARGVVGDAEHHRLEPVGDGARDRLDVRHPDGGLDQQVEVDGWEPAGMFDLRAQRRDELDVRR
jgi:hypothetical protein